MFMIAGGVVVGRSAAKTVLVVGEVETSARNRKVVRRSRI
jgi:hypothetical protein